MKVSVIVPAYNTQDYIDECIESILRQSLEGIEIIIINDNSSDGTLDKINSYKKIYDNIIVINKNKNEGVSSARNDAIKIAKGKYITFLDSDDMLNKYALEELYNNIEHTQSDMCICNMKIFRDGEKPIGINEKKEILITKIDKDEKEKEFLNDKILTSYSCGKLYKLDLFKKNHIKFPLGMLYEDAQVTFECVINSKKICILNNELYYYRMRNESTSKSISLKSLIDYKKANENIINLYKKYDLNLDNDFNNYLNRRYINHYLMIKNYKVSNQNTKEVDEIEKNLKYEINKMSYKYVRDNIDSIKLKLVYILIKLNLLEFVIKSKCVLYSIKNKHN